MSGNTEEVLEVLREVWSAQGQTADDVEEACGTTKSCKRIAGVNGTQQCSGHIRGG